MWQRFKRWCRPDWSRGGAYAFAVATTALLMYLFILGGAARYAPVGLGLLFAVIVSAYLGGLGPGLLSTLLIAVPLKILFDRHAIAAPGIPTGPPSLHFWFPIIFGLMGALASVLFQALHRSRRTSDTSRRELAATLANINDAIVTTDVVGRIQYLNRAAVGLLRHDLQDIVGQPFQDAVKIRDTTAGASPVSLLDQALSVGHTVHVSKHQVLVRDDDTQLAIEATAAPVRDLQGRITAVVVTMRDCTEQRQSERVLLDRLAVQAKVEQVAAVVPGALHEFRMSADDRRQIPYASKSFKEIFGIEPSSLADEAAPFFAIVHPDDAVRVRNARDASRRDLTPMNNEYRVLTPHRGERWVALSAMPLREADGGTHWHGVFTDVTERKQSEERLRASQWQLQAALEAGAMGVMTIDLATNAVEPDAVARGLWNLHTPSDVPLTIDHLIAAIHPDDRQEAKADYQTMIRNGARSDSREYRLLLEDGEERWLLYRGRVHKDEVTGKLIKVGVVMDTTQLRRMEEQRQHSKKLEALGVLAAGIAHDFNNLLLAISGNAKLLLADLPEADSLRASAREIDKAAARAAELVRRILTYSSVHELSQKGEPLVLRPVLDEVVELARAVLPATVAIHVSIPDTLPAILADGAQVHQALVNLLTNAADATVAAGGAVKLEVSEVDVDEALQLLTPEVKQGRYVRITVSDTGKGIDPAALSRIFDPFFTTKANGRGTGLGLAIVHGIMKSLDGAVTVRSTPGNGATFALFFPAQSAAAITTPSVAAPVPVNRAAHILYVDDEESLVFLMTRTLERMGHRVTGYLSPEAALEKFMADADQFDLVVSDMAMPGLSGIDLAERMLAVRPRLPFIITSGFLDAADVERAHAAGVRQTIMKPNTVEELSLAVAAVLRDQDISAATS